MSASSSPFDKFAFLFKTNGTFDLSAVKSTLTDYYGYPAANIMESAGCNNLLNDFQSFTNIVAGHAPAGTNKNTFIIFVVGNAVATGLNDGTNSILWDDLGYYFQTELSAGVTYLNNSEVHFYFIFPFCGEFDSRVTFIINGSVSYPVCTDFTTFNNHSAFLSDWVDVFGANADSAFDSSKMVRFELAATQIYNKYPAMPAFETFYKQFLLGNHETGTLSAYYPGYPSLELDDGVPVYKTHDIWLNNLDPDDTSIPQAQRDLYDNYEYDKDNKISVRVRVRGTHPAKSYNVGVGVFRSGGGGECDVNPSGQRAVTSATLLKPGDTKEYSYTHIFSSAYNHRCIKARVSMDTINDGDIDNDIDWDIVTRINEVQLNIDPGGIADTSDSGTGPGSGTGSGSGNGSQPDPGAGIVDENDAGNAADPAPGGSRSSANLRGFSERVYLLKNRFRTTKKFRYIIPQKVQRYENLVKFRWFAGNSKYPSRMKELNYEKEKTSYFEFTLRPGESIELVTYMATAGISKLKKPIDISFDIMIEKPARNFIFNLPVIRALTREYKLFSGVNLVLYHASGNILAHVLDEKKNPVAESVVYIKNLNGRQSAAGRTDKEGVFRLVGINTGPYRVWAVRKGIRSEPKTVNLHNGKTEKVELIIR